jgi:O-methyltransferase
MNLSKPRAIIKKRAPASLILSVRMFRDPERVTKNPADIGSVMRFLRQPLTDISLRQKLAVIRALYTISYAVDCPHTEREMLSFITTILTTPREVPGCIVEAGCYKGGGTAKFSLAAKLARRQLVVFDSFEGLPENREMHDQTIFGETPNFQKGRYYGALNEVRSNVSEYGALDVCRFIKGWFCDTMPAFTEPVAAIYLDVDLVASTKTCLKYLYPLLSPGGYVYSQDGHLPLITQVLQDEKFWRMEVGCARPVFAGISAEKLVMARKSPSVHCEPQL